MCNDDVMRIPADEDELWTVLWEQFEFVRHVLWELPIEDEEDALENAYHVEAENGVNRSGMEVIRFRSVGADLDQRDYYLKMGRELLPYIHQSLDERKLTPELVQQWGKIMFCHGYVASHVFDDTDDLAHKRAGVKTGRMRSKHAQRKWIAHIMLPLMDGGMTRIQAEDTTLEHVERLVNQAGISPDFPASWFKSVLGRNGLSTTYDDKHFSVRLMRELVNEPTDDIPPIPDKIP